MECLQYTAGGEQVTGGWDFINMSLFVTKGKYQKYLCNMHRPIHVVANIYFTKISINDVYQGTQTWFDDGH